MGNPTTKGKKGKSNKKGGKAEGGSKPIKHNAETFRLFNQLKLDAPVTTDEIPGILEELDEKLEGYKEKVKEWEEKKEEMKRKILDGTYEEEKDEEGAKEEDEKEAEDS